MGDITKFFNFRTEDKMSRKKIVVKALVVLVGLFLLSLSTSFVHAQNVPLPKTGQTISYATGDDGYR